MHSSFEVVLRTMKHTMIYPDSAPSLEAMPYIQWFDIEDEHVLQRGEQRAREVCMVKGGNGSLAPWLKGRGPFIDRSGVY
jgi:hypothetical protein